MASAGQILLELRELYPLHKDLDQVAIGLAQEQVNIQPLLDGLSDGKTTHWRLEFYQPSKIDPTRRNGIVFTAPKRIEMCATAEEALKSVTVYALLLTPAARAVLALHGYRLNVSLVAFKQKTDIAQG